MTFTGRLKKGTSMEKQPTQRQTLTDNKEYDVAAELCEAKKFMMNGEYRKACTSCKRAAELGDPLAQYWFGMLLRDGYFGKAHKNESIKWFKIAAEKGNIQAMFQLGIHYTLGIFVLQNRGQAIKYYKMAARKGHPKAAEYLKIIQPTI